MELADASLGAEPADGSFLQHLAEGEPLSPILSSIMAYLSDDQVDALAVSKLVVKKIEKTETNPLYWKEKVEHWFGVTLKDSLIDWKWLYEKLAAKGYASVADSSADVAVITEDFRDWKPIIPEMKTAFTIVARHDDIAILKVILDAYRGRVGLEELKYLILESTGSGSWKVAAELLREPGLIKYISKGLDYVMEVASTFHQHQIIKMILDSKERIASSILKDAFYAAISSGNLDTMELFLDDGRVDLVELANSESRLSPISMAASSGKLDIVKRLLEIPEVDPSADDNEALEWAMKNSHHDVAKLLLKDPRVLNELSDTELDEYEMMLGNI